MAALAQQVLNRCDQVASFTEEAGKITRTFLSGPMRGLHQLVTAWMSAAGMTVHCDPAGNLIGRYEGVTPSLPVLMIGSHLDTVPDAGKYDGVLGVLLAKYVFIPGLVAAGNKTSISVWLINFRVSPDTLLLAFAVSVGVGVLAGFVPALRSSQRKIVDGLRQVV